MEGEGDTARPGASGNRVWKGLHVSSSFVLGEGRGARFYVVASRGLMITSSLQMPPQSPIYLKVRLVEILVSLLVHLSSIHRPFGR